MTHRPKIGMGSPGRALHRAFGSRRAHVVAESAAALEVGPEADDSTSSLDRLRRLVAITEAALAHLSVDDVVEELLIQVRDSLSADTVAVLLLDDRRDQLVARAAKGLEEEVRRGVRIPLGKGFAGTIAATGQPIAVFDIDHSMVINPILKEKGVRSLLGVPLVVEGRIVGVLHVGTLTPRRFSDEDARFLQTVADRVALVLHAGLYERERAVARTLQKSFLPEELPVVPGLELAARYLPARRGDVGGDWYDVFILPNGSVGIAIGDVVGRGVTAATMMVRLRNSLRAFTMESSSPGEVLSRLNRLTLHFDPDSIATVLFGIVELEDMRFRFANAGHISPICRTNGGTAFMPTTASGPPLGVVDHSYVDTDRVLLPDTTVVLCTDGLIERRHQSLDVGLRRLCQPLIDGRPDAVADAIITRFLTDEDHDDDVALLVAWTSGAARSSLAELGRRN
jgi:putative methionine-R-sulfoxide reductase with GAF domain